MTKNDAIKQLKAHKVVLHGREEVWYDSYTGKISVGDMTISALDFASSYYNDGWSEAPPRKKRVRRGGCK